MDSGPGTMLLVFSGLALVYWTMLGIHIWVLRRPVPLHAPGLAMACALAVIVGHVAADSAADTGAEIATNGATSAATNGWSEGGTERGVVASAPRRGRRYTSKQHARVDSIRLALVPLLEAWRQENGQYPPTLGAAGIAPPHTPYGPLDYYGSRGERPPWYTISYGSPGEHGFYADWDSRTGEWTVIEMER